MHTQDAGIRYISAGIAEQQEGLIILNVSTNNLTHDGIHHISAMLVSLMSYSNYSRFFHILAYGLNISLICSRVLKVYES